MEWYDENIDGKEEASIHGRLKVLYRNKLECRRT